MEAISTTSLNAKRDELVAIIDTVLKRAKTLGATAAEADIGAGAGLSANVRMGEIDKLEFERDKGLSVTLYVNGQKGSANTSDFSPAALEKTVDAATTDSIPADWEATILAFACHYCAFAAADLAGVMRLSYSPNVKIIRLSCTGKLDHSYVLRAFERGIDGVFVAG